MAKNANLNKAKDAKVDEFYTRREDIEAELSHYREHFKDKIVYCNCDDPTWSEFWQFFVRVFKDWGLKKLMATHYEPDEKNFAYKLEITEDTNGDGRIDCNDEPTITQIQCNGDFRNQICIEMLKEADIVVTNPPFSLFREYIAQLIQYNKSFLVIGPLNAVKYQDTFPLLRDGKMWVGYTFPKVFRVPDGTTDSNVYVENGITYKKFGNIQWFTNLDIPKRHVMLDLRGNYYKKGSFPEYINYKAIDVNKVNDIPCDFDGDIGVPISFLADFNPDQFELIGVAESSLGVDIGFSAKLSEDECKKLFEENRSFRRGNPIYRDKSGKLHKPFSRVIIRNKNPEPRRFHDED